VCSSDLVEFTVRIDPDMSIRDSRILAKKTRKRMCDEIENAKVVVNVEPYEGDWPPDSWAKWDADTDDHAEDLTETDKHVDSEHESATVELETQQADSGKTHDINDIIDINTVDNADLDDAPRHPPDDIPADTHDKSDQDHTYDLDLPDQSPAPDPPDMTDLDSNVETNEDSQVDTSPFNDDDVQPEKRFGDDIDDGDQDLFNR